MARQPNLRTVVFMTNNHTDQPCSCNCEAKLDRILEALESKSVGRDWKHLPGQTWENVVEIGRKLKDSKIANSGPIALGDRKPASEKPENPSS